MQVSFTPEHFELIASQAETVKRSLPRHIIAEEAQAALESLANKIHVFALETLESLKELPPDVNASSLLHPQIRQTTRLIEKEFADIDKGTKPYTIYEDRIRAFTILDPLYKQLSNPTETYQTTWKEHALRIEQELLHESYYEEYIAHLHAIAKLTESNAFLTTPTLYVCHSWPTLENKHEGWIPSFLQKFANDLESAGMVVFINSQKTYQTSHQYKILTADHVPVVGSPSLVERAQHDPETLGMLELIKTRIKKILSSETTFNESPLIPLLICGSKNISFPPIIAALQISDFSGNESMHDDRLSYLVSLKALMEHIYAVPDDPSNQARVDWENLWNRFFDKHSEFVQGLTQSSVEEYIQKEKKLQKAYPSLLVDPPYLQQSVPYTEDLVSDLQTAAHTTITSGLQSHYQSKRTIQNVLGLPLAIDQHYTELVIVDERAQKEKDFQQKAGKKLVFKDKRISTWENIHRPKKSINLKNLFDKWKNESSYPHHIVLTGRAGIGKSTLCQYISYQWAHQKLWENRFDAVFWIPLRYLLDQGEANPFQAMIHHCFFPEKQRLLDPKSLEQFVRDRKDRVLFILDGYDEISASLRPGTQIYQCVQELLEQKNWILTSRPYAIPKFQAIHSVSVDRKIENIGFTRKGIKTFVKKYFSKKLYSQFLLDVKRNPSVFGSAHIPLNLGLICSIWEKNDNGAKIPLDSFTMTSLYTELTNTLLHRFLHKQGIDGSEWQESDFDNDSIYSSAIRFLEALAWEGLKQESIILSFKNERLKELYLYYSPEPKSRAQWKHAFLNLGFLTSSAQSASLADNDYYFIHLTFQEFFAAKYLKRLMKKDPEKAKKLIVDCKFNPRYQVVFWFLAGLLKHNEQLLNHFFWLLDHPKDLIGVYRIGLIIRCLEECECSKLLKTKKDLLDDVRAWTKIASKGICESSRGTQKSSYYVYRSLSHLLKISPQIASINYISFLCQKLKDTPSYDDTKQDMILDELEVLGKNDPERIIPLLLSLLSSRRDCFEYEDELIPIIRTLDETTTGDPSKVIPPLLNGLDDEDPNIRYSAALYLAEVGHHDLNKTVPALIKAAENADNFSEGSHRFDNMSKDNTDVRNIAIIALGKLGKYAYKEVLIFLESAAKDERMDLEVVLNALAIVGKKYPKRVISKIKQMEKSINRVNAYDTLEVLDQIAHKAPEKIISVLLSHAKDDRAAKWRLIKIADKLARLDSLDKLNSDQLIEHITLYTHDEDVFNRENAIKVLAKLVNYNPKKVISTLAEASQDKAEIVREVAFTSLAKLASFHPEQVTATLNHISEIGEKRTQSQASKILKKLEKQHAKTTSPSIFTDSYVSDEDIAYSAQGSYSSDSSESEENLSTPSGDSLIKSTSIEDLIFDCQNGAIEETRISAIVLECLESNRAIFIKTNNALGFVERSLIVIRVPHTALQAVKIQDMCCQILFPKRSAQSYYEQGKGLTGAFMNLRWDQQTNSENLKAQAIEFYQKAAHLGHREALYELVHGWVHHLWDPGEEHLIRTARYLQTAHLLGHPNAKTDLINLENSRKLITTHLPESVKKTLLYLFDHHPRLSLFNHPVQFQSLCQQYKQLSSVRELFESDAMMLELYPDPTYTECLSYLVNILIQEIDYERNLETNLGQDTTNRDYKDELKQLEKPACDLLIKPETQVEIPLNSTWNSLNRIFDSSPFAFLPLREYLAASWLTNLSAATNLMEVHSLNPRFLHVWPLVAGLSQNPIFFHSLPKDLFQGYATPLHIFCLEQYKDLTFAKMHLKEIKLATKQALSAKGLTWKSRQIIQALTVCPRVMQATGINEWTFPVRKESLIPLSAARLVHDSDAADLLLKDLKSKKRQHLACLVIAESGVMREEFIQPVLDLITHSKRKVRQSAEHALSAMARAAPQKIAPFLQDLFAQDTAQQSAIQAWKAMDDQIPEESLMFLKEQLKHDEHRTVAIAVLERVNQSKIKDWLKPWMEPVTHQESPISPIDNLFDQLNHEKASTKKATLAKIAKHDPSKWSVSRLLMLLSNENANVRETVASLLSQVTLKSSNFSWTMVSNETKSAFQKVPLDLPSLLPKLGEKERLQAMVYLLAQDIQLVYENGELRFFDPHHNSLQSVKCSKDMIAQLRNDHNFLLSIPMSLFQWIRAKEHNREKWNYLEDDSRFEISLAEPLSDQHELPNRLHALEKALTDWLRTETSFKCSYTSLQLETKHSKRLKKILELFEISEKAVTLSESLSSDSSSSSSSDEKESDE